MNRIIGTSRATTTFANHGHRIMIRSSYRSVVLKTVTSRCVRSTTRTATCRAATSVRRAATTCPCTAERPLNRLYWRACAEPDQCRSSAAPAEKCSSFSAALRTTRPSIRLRSAQTPDSNSTSMCDSPKICNPAAPSSSARNNVTVSLTISFFFKLNKNK